MDLSDGNLYERRSSSRIRKLNSDRTLSGCKVSKYVEEPEIKSKRNVKRKRADKPKVSFKKEEDKQVKSQSDCVGEVEIKEAAPDAATDTVVNRNDVEGRSAHAVVRAAIRSFYTHYLHFVQEEEKRCGKVEADIESVKDDSKTKKIVKKGDSPKENSKRSSKRPDSKALKTVTKGDAQKENSKHSSRRPDLKALTKMLETGSALRPNRIGSIPGIDVGHQFFSRAEMVAAGFHNHWLNGIDYVGKNGSKIEDLSRYTLPITVAIVISGQYEDDLDNCEDVIYTGQGGNNLLGNKQQIGDQKLERGNLGLKNSLDQKVPVRVIRGHESKISYVGKVYTYDGLYEVVNYWAETGISGFTVYKFRLKRLEGQPSLTTAQVQFTRGQIPNSISEIRGLVCEDISGGQEIIPIRATNVVDDPPVAPTGFTYCTKIEVPKSVKLPTQVPGCACRGNCVNSRNCICATLNGTDFAYVNRDGGRIIEPKAVVFECGPNCGCGPECVNRTSQRGLRYRLEVFRTAKKGWAVRSWDFIPSGAPVIEYIGKLRKTSDVDIDPENNYLFDIDCLQTMKGLDGREKRVGDVPLPSYMVSDDDMDNGPEYCLDAGNSGNVARFINHSCQPNLFVQCVLNTHHDAKLARVVLFASDNIPPLKELSYDYGYALDSVLGPDGEIKKLECFCGAADCRKRMF
ncbi:histone-lysine N-methyltransferase, H3 lysine-9 specific SUVH4-like isoform X2 [Apium graveolens]|uniref:histone-lysine N-methyltransferase, H3 lysine-9 specific SUVH4-like isoform X2 n=1 Tax=Apium graveolens TaxID=4045 RepID=UPI003D7BB51C